jgi:hypothetical protein
LEGNERLRTQLSLAQESLKTLTGSLVVANEEAARYRQRYSDLEFQIKALGLESMNKDQKRLEQRLLNAVSDLRLTQTERDKYRDQILSLSEAVLHLLKTSTAGDAKARMDVEEQLRASNQVAVASFPASAETPSLVDGRVVSVKQDWSFVVGNIGAQHGVKMGMPIRVMRDDKLVTTLRVVDVRRKICGAVIQDLASGEIHVGDHLQVDLRPM